MLTTLDTMPSTSVQTTLDATPSTSTQSETIPSDQSNLGVNTGAIGDKEERTRFKRAIKPPTRFCDYLLK
ncbi:hypothetical protein NDU88_008385 [Pleurodeles waltl]|uniref:Uncharacterized protein n=1 Tax=Pleurodeles waltl TaxID=8319 RepID=A0AAV7NWE1_PLEWA|nr:hypothetical protein NDU88_008385 [Pleurodeles waltl]